MSLIRALVVAPLLVGGLFLSACSSSPNVPVSSARGDSGPSGAPVGAMVTLANVSFAPYTVSITTGQSVEWVWDDGAIPHNVTFISFQATGTVAGATSSLTVRVPGFHSATQTSGTYFHTFTIPGTYTYRCTIHPTMFGQVFVRP